MAVARRKQGQPLNRNPGSRSMLSTMDEVIEKLGGNEAVRKLTGKGQNNLGNWRTIQKKFPGWTYLILTDALARKGYTAPAKLWGILDPP